MTVSEVYKSACHLKQSNTKGADGLDGKILRLLESFIAETLTYIYIYIAFVLTKTPSARYLRKQKLSPSSNLVTNRTFQTLDPLLFYLFKAVRKTYH